MKYRRLKFVFVNSLTLGRMPLILVFLSVNLLLIRRNGAGELVLLKDESHAFWFAIAFGAMVLSALTDLFDGYYARKFQVVSNLGAYADPLTDKIFYLTSFPTLVFIACLKGASVQGGHFFHAQLLLALTIIFLLRDQWISFLRSIGAIHNVSAKANWSGKARTVISFPSICCIYWYFLAPHEWLPRLYKTAWPIYLLEVVSLGINLISIWVYTVYYWPCIQKELRATEEGKPEE